MLLIYFLRHLCQLIKQAKEESLWKMCQNGRNTQRCNNKKETDEKVDAYEKQLRSKYIKLMKLQNKNDMTPF